MNWRPRDLEDVARLFAALFGLCYVLGLVSVNIYLHSLGTSEFSVFRARFVLCGFLILMLLIFPFVSFIYLERVEHRYYARKIGQNDRLAISTDGLIVGIVVPIAACVAFFAWTHAASIQWNGVRCPAWVFLPLVAYALAALTYVFLSAASFPVRRKCIDSEEPKDDMPDDEPAVPYVVPYSRALIRENIVKLRDTVSKLSKSDQELEELRQRIRDLEDEMTTMAQTARYWSPLVVACIFAVFGIYIYYFSTLALPHVPEQFGGAKPRLCVIIFAPDFANGAAALGLVSPVQSAESVPVHLLWESDQGYVLRPADASSDQTYKLAKSSVLAVVIQ